MTSIVAELLDRIASHPCCGYERTQPPRVEPTALAALALSLHGRTNDAHAALDWLASVQNSDGSFGVDATLRQPHWPTGWAALAFRAATQQTAATWPFAEAADRGAQWLLSSSGEPLERENKEIVGHDTTLRGWPWVETTHSWIEPTATAVLALKAMGHARHPRCREAVRLIIDRTLPGGGWNYGNTIVLGNTLLPHVQPTGLALAALAGEAGSASAIERAVGYLRRTLTATTAAASLGYALLGMELCRLPPSRTSEL
ncbi:MAG: hypothetical protein ACOY3P_10725, partial [Planctomycetota bacterium]